MEPQLLPEAKRRRLCFPTSTSNPTVPLNSYRRFRLVCRNGSSGFFNTKLHSGGEAVNNAAAPWKQAQQTGGKWTH